MTVTFLSQEQVDGRHALEVIKKYGRRTPQTDLAIILGGVSTGTNESKACQYWTSTLADGKDFTSKDEVTTVFGSSIQSMWPTARFISSRPVIEDAYRIRPNNIHDLKLKNGKTVQICEYGEYPQTIVNDNLAIKLEDDFQNNRLKVTGKSYTFAKEPVRGSNTITGYKCPEYITDGQKYIRVLGNPLDRDSMLSNGLQVQMNVPYWVEVQPIEWLKDDSGILIAKKALFAGILFDCNPIYNGNFADTFMAKTYLPIFENEMQPSSGLARTQTLPHVSNNTNINTNTNTRTNSELEKDTDKLDTISSEPNERQDEYGIRVEQSPMSVSEQLQFYFDNGMSCMLHGLSGIGKTARVEEIDANLTAVPLWNGVLPEDIVGKVIYPDGTFAAATEENISKGTWVAPDWYNELTKKCQAEPDKKHVLFIDEVTNARPTTQSLIFHMVLKKSISPSKGKLPDNCVVMLAGNSKEESGAAYNMPEPLFRRMCGHIYLKPDIGEWLMWGSEPSRKHPEDTERKNIHPLVASFVATYGQDTFYTAYDEENPKEWAMDPRGWEQVSDLIYDNKGIIRKELLVGKMGEELTAAFIGYANNPPLSKKAILAKKYSSSDIPTGSDARLALALSLRDANEKEVGPIRKFISDNLGKENLAVFDSLWVGKNDERALQIAQMQSFMNKGR